MIKKIIENDLLKTTIIISENKRNIIIKRLDKISKKEKQMRLFEEDIKVLKELL